MKTLSILLLISLTINVNAASWNDPVKGTNSTYRDLWIQQNMINNSMRTNQKSQNELKGTGTDFSGIVEIQSAPTMEDPNKKSYKVYIRGCGKVDLPTKSEEDMANIKNGSTVKLKFTGSRTCQVSDWSKN